jgi:hypothetical protein
MATAAALIKTTARDEILDLAKRHGIIYEETALDRFAKKAAELSDAEATLDDIDHMLVALRRANILDGTTATQLHIRYLNETGA